MLFMLWWTCIKHVTSGTNEEEYWLKNFTLKCEHDECLNSAFCLSDLLLLHIYLNSSIVVKTLKTLIELYYH